MPPYEAIYTLYVCEMLHRNNQLHEIKYNLFSLFFFKLGNPKLGYKNSSSSLFSLRVLQFQGVNLEFILSSYTIPLSLFFHIY